MYTPGHQTFAFNKKYVCNFYFNRVISVISVALRETFLIISDSTGEPVSMEYEIVRVFSLSTTLISEIVRLKILSSGSENPKPTCVVDKQYLTQIRIF